ncbi:MAG: signal peptidase I [Fimbriimonadales bacterium]|nr:signal peptidase I [Fimbriimonadales bacterium]MDW8051108.1 signal peptidase I [Armatimonadota bacterium]
MHAVKTKEADYPLRNTRALVLLTIFGLLALFFALNFRIVVVNGPSMEPTYKDGDRLLMTNAYWLFGEIRKGDVVVIIRPKGDLLIKRVVALAGEPIPKRYWTPLVYMMGGRVPEGHIFVVGDNLAQSEDSRHIGAIPLSWVQGKIVGGWQEALP